MKPRTELARFIEKQLDDAGKGDRNFPFHYGRVELRALMDFIYGEKPTCDSENIK